MNKLFLNLKEGFLIPIHYRLLIWILALKELKIRYRGSVLGFFWSILNPLLLLLVYVFVFSVIFKASAKAYPVYLFVGLLPWNWFSGAINEATISIVSSGAFVNKSTLPSELLVIIKVISNFINFAISLPALVLFILSFKVQIGLPLITLPIVIFIQFLLTCGAGFFVATWEVYYRDMQHIVMTLLQFFFFAIPIMYFANQLPQKAQMLIYLNPLAYLIKSYQGIFYHNWFPKTLFLLLLAIGSVIVYMLGFMYFKSQKEEFPESV